MRRCGWFKAGCLLLLRVHDADALPHPAIPHIIPCARMRTGMRAAFTAWRCVLLDVPGTSIPHLRAGLYASGTRAVLPFVRGMRVRTRAHYLPYLYTADPGCRF